MGKSSSKEYHPKQQKIDSTTAAYKFAQTHEYRHKFFEFGLKPYTPHWANVTLVTHLTSDRLSVFEKQAGAWRGNISVSIYLPKRNPEGGGTDEKQLTKYISKSKILNSRQNIRYVLVYGEGEIYPINFMRNLALNNAKSAYVFLLDVDFIPNESLFINNADRVQQMLSKDDKCALIVPAFEANSKDLVFPGSKEQLFQMQKNNLISTFHSKIWPRGHEATNYSKWRTASDLYTVDWQPSYEPFIIVRQDIPRFDRKFVGYGWDKVSHVMELSALGFKFQVLPNDFIIHFPHKESSDNKLFRSSKQFQRCFSAEKSNFLARLTQRYGADNEVIMKYNEHVLQSAPLYKEEFYANYQWSQSGQLKTEVGCYQFYGQPLVEFETDITLVTQLTMDRFFVFESLCSRWTGPISATFYLDDSIGESKTLGEFIRTSQFLRHRINIGYHIVHREGVFYPINYLRNVALNNANTDYVFLVDVDFLPNAELYPILMEKIYSGLIRGGGGSKRCFVIPAFEMPHNIGFPETKPELLRLLKTGLITSFYYNEWPTGHEPTDYPKWSSATEPYLINWKPDFEPYIVIDKRGVPPYDNRFVGYGWNKISHIMEVIGCGYEFMVLPDTYIVHIPHPDSREKTTFKNNDLYKKTSKKTRRQFLSDFRKTYGDAFYFAHFYDYDTGGNWSDHDGQDGGCGSPGGSHGGHSGHCSFDFNHDSHHHDDYFVDSMMSTMVAYN